MELQQPQVTSHKNYWPLLTGVLLVALIAAAGFFVWQKQHPKAVKSFSDCKKAGGVLLQTFPLQCAINGQRFTDDTPADTQHTASFPGKSFRFVYQDPSFSLEVPEAWTERTAKASTIFDRPNQSQTTDAMIFTAVIPGIAHLDATEKSTVLLGGYVWDFYKENSYFVYDYRIPETQTVLNFAFEKREEAQFILPTLQIPAQNLDTASWTTFTNTTYGYSLRYPPSWKSEPDGRFSNKEQGSGFSQDGIRTLFYVGVFSDIASEVGASNPKYLSKNNLTLLMQDPDYKNVTHITFLGIPAFKTTFTNDKIDLSETQIWFVRNGLVYQIVYDDTFGDPATKKAILDSITFTLTK
jgi:hypothetical protein